MRVCPEFLLFWQFYRTNILQKIVIEAGDWNFYEYMLQNLFFTNPAKTLNNLAD